MGLDMFLDGKKFFIPQSDDSVKLENGFAVKEHVLELGYWRKHPNLHGYIVQNFAAGVDECQPIYLSEERLEKLIEAVTKNELIPTTGFFFGKSPEDSAEYDSSILKKALKWLRASKKGECRDVVYHASW